MIERETTLLALTTLMLAIGGFVGPVRAEAQGTASAAAETLFVYGPGGPLPAMKELGADFERLHGIRVVVTGGPTPQWLSMARANADVIFSGALAQQRDREGALDERHHLRCLDHLERLAGRQPEARRCGAAG